MAETTHVIRFEMNATIEWRAFRDPKTNVWIGVCDALSVTAQGDTWDELEQSIREIQNELFVSLHEEGELVQFLRDRGWSPTTSIPSSASSSHHLKLDIPTKVVPVAHAS